MPMKNDAMGEASLHPGVEDIRYQGQTKVRIVLPRHANWQAGLKGLISRPGILVPASLYTAGRRVMEYGNFAPVPGTCPGISC